MAKNVATTIDTPDVILQNGTAGTSIIYTNKTSAKISVEAPLFDYVDNNEPDVDSSADEGMHSNFTAQQAGLDVTYDTLTEENTEAIEDYVDNNLSDVDSSSDVGSHSNFENQKDHDSTYDTLTEQNTGAGITKVGTDTSGTGNNLTLSFSHTLVSGTTRIVIVSIGIENGDTIDVSTVTYDGVAMTLAVDGITSTSGFRYLNEIWYILENDLPSDGSKTVQISCSGTANELEVNGFCSEYTGVTQGAPEATAEHNQTAGATITNNISPSDNAWVVSVVGSGNAGSFTHGQGQVEVLDFMDTSSTFAIAELRGASGETSLDSTYSGVLNRLERVAASWAEVIDDNYELDLEIQFTTVIDFLSSETLYINTGTFSGTENINVDFWNGTGWENLATDLTAYSCNYYTVSLTSTNFTIRFKGGNESGDTIQDQWQIDASLLRVEGAGSIEDAVDQQSNVDGSADIGTHSNFTAQQYGPDSIYDTLTEADTSVPDDNNVDSEIVTYGSTTGISGAQTVDSVTENMTEGTEGTPTLEGTPQVAEGDSTTFTVNVPTDVSGGIQSGDYIVVVAMHCESEDNTWGVPTGMDGEWVSELQVGQTPPSIPGTQVFYELCEGGESGNRSSVGTFVGGWVAICFVVRGVDTTTPLDVTPTTAQSTTTGQPNPPSITPTSDNCMIVIVGFMDDSDTTGTISSPPSPYILIEDQVQTSTPTNGRIGVAYRILATAQTEDPGTWTMDGNDEWAGITIVLRPAPTDCQLDVEHVVNSIGNYDNYNLTTRAYRTAPENFYLQMYNFTSSQWVNMSTITASSLTWYNTTFAKIDFVNSTNQARIRYWQGMDAAQETLYVDYCGVYGWNSTNYELDLEGHWTGLSYSLPNEELCIYAGAVGTEDIKVDVWNGSSWINVISDLNASSWNNVTIASYLSSSNFTIRFKGGSETGDVSQDTWQIDVALIHVWHGEENYQLDLEVQWTNAEYTRTNEELCINTGPFSGSEDIQVRVWNTTGSSWHWVMNLTASQWNNVSIMSYLTSSTFTVQFLGGTETGDITQDSWNIDATLLHVWGGASAWLSGWDKRVRITIDRNDIDTALSNFPILVYLSNSSSGRNNDDVSFIFDELQNDTNRKKIALTKSDGLTQCYIEIEKWDDVSEQAWLWVEVPNVSNTTDTDLYLYYDKDHANNTAYVDDTNTGNSVNVWNSNFKMVQHMRDNTTSSIVDSTSNNNDGTKSGAGQPAAVASGKIDGAQNFTSGNVAGGEYIDCGNDASLQITGYLTVEAWVTIAGSDGEYLGLGGKLDDTDQEGYALVRHTDNRFRFWVGDGAMASADSDTTYTDSDWHYVVGVVNNGNNYMYVDGTKQTDEDTTTLVDSGNYVHIGRQYDDYDARYWGGLIDEFRISNTSRSAAWIKASYESGRDDLLDFASEGGESTSEGTYDYVLKVNNTETDSWQIRLKKYSDSNINRLQNCTIYFHNSSDGTSRQIYILDGSYINQTGPWYDLGNSETIYIAMVIKGNSKGTSYIHSILEIRTPGTTTYLQYRIKFEIT